MIRTISIIIVLFFSVNVLGQNDKLTVKKIVFEHYFKRGNKDISKPTTIHIDVINDSIWRYVKEDDKQIGDYYRIDTSGKMYYHAKINKKIIYREYDLFNSNDKYLITEKLNETKLISGYLCHKVLIERQEFDENGEKEFISNYEMYVTKDINLPVHALLNISENLKNYFPLEIRVTTFAFDIPQEFYKVKYIE